MILVSLTMTLLSDKYLPISNRCISGLMPNFIKKSWTNSTSQAAIDSFHRYSQILIKRGAYYGY